jgi:hypothetical protein
VRRGIDARQEEEAAPVEPAHAAWVAPAAPLKRSPASDAAMWSGEIQHGRRARPRVSALSLQKQRHIKLTHARQPNLLAISFLFVVVLPFFLCVFSCSSSCNQKQWRQPRLQRHTRRRRRCRRRLVPRSSGLRPPRAVCPHRRAQRPRGGAPPDESVQGYVRGCGGEAADAAGAGGVRRGNDCWRKLDERSLEVGSGEASMGPYA